MSGKTYLVILCGAPDRPCSELAGRTPFEAARTPNLDSLAARGCQGLIRIIDERIPPESDSGAMALLSYDPLTHYTGRGPLEGLGTGFLAPGRNAVCFRVNFASYDAGGGAVERRTARDLTDADLQALAQSLREKVRLPDWPGVRFNLMAFGRHRGILSFESDALPLSGNVSNTDPGFEKIGAFGVPVADVREPKVCEPLDNSEAAANTAALVNAFVHESASVLKTHPVNAARREAGKLAANIILFRDGGDEPRRLQAFRERTGAELSFFGQIPAEKGLMSLIGGNFTYARQQESEDDTRYLNRVCEAILADPAQVVAVHLKGADEPGHDGDAARKVAALETLDHDFFGPLLSRMHCDDTVIATSDHATPCELKIHGCDPVPVAIRGPNIMSDPTSRFGERAASAGQLPISHATELMGFVLGRERRS